MQDCSTFAPIGSRLFFVFFAMRPLWLGFSAWGRGKEGGFKGKLQNFSFFTFFCKDQTEEGLNARSSLHGAANFTPEEDDEPSLFARVRNAFGN